MKKVFSFSMLTLLLLFAGTALADEQAPQKVIDLANTTLAAYGADPVIVTAVKTENAKNKTLDQIKEMDKKWMATPGLDAFMKSLLESECGKYLKAMAGKSPYFAEIFVMDNQGANVAMSDKTSDYWQGDEAKFQKSFNNGAGAVFIDKVKFDDSAQAYLVQVSVPVKDGGKVIGAITFGINIDKI